MREEIVKTKTGVMVRKILTRREREEARKRLYKVMDSIYENYMKVKSKH